MPLLHRLERIKIWKGGNLHIRLHCLKWLKVALALALAFALALVFGHALVCHRTRAHAHRRAL